MTDSRLVDALSQTTLTIASILNSVGARYDLSLTQVRAIGILRDRTLPMAALADYLGLSRQTLSGLIDRAESRDLVKRVRSEEDRRSVEVALTDEGKRLARSAEREIADALTPLTEVLSAKQRTQLTNLLETMLNV